MQQLIQKVYDILQLNNNLFIQAGLQPIRTVDLYRGQPQNPEAFEIFETPAIFLDWRIKWQRIGGSREGTGQLDVHMVMDDVFGTAKLFTNYQAALQQSFGYELVDAILNGLESPISSKLEQVDEYPVDTGANVYHVYSYNFTTYKPISQTNTIQAGQGVVLQINRQLVTDIKE